MLKVSNRALSVLALLPTAAIAQTQAPPTAQTETANNHRADHAEIENLMKQSHDAIVSHDGDKSARLFLPNANIYRRSSNENVTCY